MPHGVAFWQPAAPLRPYVSGYHRYDIALADGARLADAFYPAWTNLRFTVSVAGEWSIRIGRRRFDPVPRCALFGPSSHAGYVDATAGTLIGVGLTPVGWARLIGGDASAVADRVVPLASIVPEAAAIADRLAAGEPPEAVFDAWLLARLAANPPEDPAIARLFEALNDPAIDGIPALAAATEIGPRSLIRLSRMHFGFTPKLLLRRARFVRALVAAMQHDRGQWADVVRAAGYFDGSHFLRDCHAFLDQPLGTFEAMPRPLNRASAAARMRLLGAPMQSLHHTDIPAGAATNRQQL